MVTWFHPQTLGTISPLMLLFFMHFFSFRCRISAKIDRIKQHILKARKVKSQNCYYQLLTVGRIYNSFPLYLELSRSQFSFRRVYSLSSSHFHTLISNLHLHNLFYYYYFFLFATHNKIHNKQEC